MAGTWDVAKTNANIALSGGSLVATLTGTPNQDAIALATDSHASGKFVFSATLNLEGGHGIGIGVGAASTPIGNGQYLGEDANSVAYYATGGFWLINNTTPIGSLNTATTGDTVWCAVDFAAKLAWVKINSGIWQGAGSASANPDAGTFGFDISGLSGFTLFPGTSLWTANDQVTADFTGAGSGLSTFLPWSSGAPSPANGSLTQTIADLTLSGAGKAIAAGALAKTITDLTLSGAGKAIVAGSLAKTITDLTLSSAGTIGTVRSGALTQTIADLTLSGAGKALATGSLAKTIADLTPAATGTVVVNGALSKTIPDIRLSGGSSKSSGVGSIRFRLGLGIGFIGVA